MPTYISLEKTIAYMNVTIAYKVYAMNIAYIYRDISQVNIHIFNTFAIEP